MAKAFAEYAREREATMSPAQRDLMRAFDQAAGFGSVLLAHARLAVSASRIWLSSPR